MKPLLSLAPKMYFFDRRPSNPNRSVGNSIFLPSLPILSYPISRLLLPFLWPPLIFKFKSALAAGQTHIKPHPWGATEQTEQDSGGSATMRNGCYEIKRLTAKFQ